jgi:general stress protein YciG
MAQNNNRGGDDQNSERGFASMDDDKQREIASEGGRAAHASGRAHEFDSQEAREAGQKGGQSRGGSQGERSSSGSSRSDRDMQASGRDRDEQGQFTSDRGDNQDRNR